MGKASAPPTPPYVEAAKETAAGNQTNQRSATMANRVNTLLNQQNASSLGMANMQNQALGRVGSAMGSSFDMSSLPGGGQVFDAGAAPSMGSVYDPSQATDAATEAVMSRLRPQFARDEEAMASRLANQGITSGSEAYDREQGQFGRNKNDAYTQAALQGINLGMQQQGQQYGQRMGQRGLFGQEQNMRFGQQQAAQQQALQLQSYLRSLPLNEFNAFRTGSQVTNPTFANALKPTFARSASSTTG